MDRVRLFAVVLVIALLLFVAIYETTPIGGTEASYTGFTVDGRHFALTYLATSNSAIERGLMNTKVTDNTTMLFVFSGQGRYSFWMEGVNSSLDIIWISARGNVGKVVYLVADAPGCQLSLLCPTYQPSATANLVLEAKGGFAASNGITIGTSIEFD